MSREQLDAAAQHFFLRILPAATGKRLSDLQNPDVMLGAYRRHSGAPVQSFGRPITPQFMLKVGRTPLSIQSGSVALGTAPVGVDAADQPLIWMRFAADAKVDDQATIRDLMGDLDTTPQRKFSVAGVEIDLGADAPVPPNSQQWSQAVQNSRAAIPENLTAVTDVPEGLKGVAPDIHSLRMILGHFFTYDENGAYYPRWSGAGRQIPQDLSDPYKQNNVRELKLQREQLYLYMLTPKRLFTSKQLRRTTIAKRSFASMRSATPRIHFCRRWYIASTSVSRRRTHSTTSCFSNRKTVWALPFQQPPVKAFPRPSPNS